MDELADRLVVVLALRAARGVGDTTLRQVLGLLDAETDLSSVRSALLSSPSISAHARLALEGALRPREWERLMGTAMRSLEQAERLGVSVLLFDHPMYPPLLRAVRDAPVLLFAKGKLCEDRRAVACVGTREPSHFGQRAADQITRCLANSGWTIVSGLAKGIDSIAHRAALACGARTIAILGNGLDSVYPAANRRLAEDIVESGGLLLSEQPFGAEPLPRNLVSRDRLQSGMSVATVVFETSVTGGAMHTARFAREQGRLIVCPVPPPEYRALPSCSGITKLLEDGGVFPVPGREACDSLCRELDRRLAEWSNPNVVGPMDNRPREVQPGGEEGTGKPRGVGQTAADYYQPSLDFGQS